MSVSWKKLKVGPRQLTPEEIVAYIADSQPSGDYYSEAGQALMMWHVTERAAVVLGIAQAGERPSQQEVGRNTLSLLISGRTRGPGSGSARQARTAPRWAPSTSRSHRLPSR